MSRSLQAFRTMLRQAARDPLWAISAIVLGIAHGGRHLLFSIVTTAFVGLVLFATVSIGLPSMGWQNTGLHLAANIVVVIIMVALLWRLLMQPMVAHSVKWMTAPMVLRGSRPSRMANR